MISFISGVNIFKNDLLLKEEEVFWTIDNVLMAMKLKNLLWTHEIGLYNF